MTTENQPARMGDAVMQLVELYCGKHSSMTKYIRQDLPAVIARELSAHGGDGGDVENDGPPAYMHTYRKESKLVTYPVIGREHVPEYTGWTQVRTTPLYYATQQPASGECPCGGEFVTACIKCGEPPATAAHGGSGEGLFGVLVCAKHGIDYKKGCPDCDECRFPPTSASDAEGEAVVDAACRLYAAGVRSGHHDTVEGNYTDVFYHDGPDYYREEIRELLQDSDYIALTRSPARVGGESKGAPLEVVEIATPDCGYGFSGYAVMSDGSRQAQTVGLHATPEGARAAVEAKLAGDSQ